MAKDTLDQRDMDETYTALIDATTRLDVVRAVVQDMQANPHALAGDYVDRLDAVVEGA